MTAMHPDVDRQELRDLLHGTRLIVHLVRSQYEGKLEGFDTIMANVKRFVDGDDTTQDMGSWGIVSDRTSEGAQELIRNAVAELGEACAYATIDSGSLAIEHAFSAISLVIEAGVPIEAIEAMMRMRGTVIKNWRAANGDFQYKTDEDWEKWDREIEAKSLVRQGFTRHWSRYRAALREAAHAAATIPVTHGIGPFTENIPTAMSTTVFPRKVL